MLCFKALQVLTHLLPPTASGRGAGWSRCSVKSAISYLMDFVQVCLCLMTFWLHHCSLNLLMLCCGLLQCWFTNVVFQTFCVTAWNEHLIIAWESWFIEGPALHRVHWTPKWSYPAVSDRRKKWQDCCATWRWRADLHNWQALQDVLGLQSQVPCPTAVCLLLPGAYLWNTHFC